MSPLYDLRCIKCKEVFEVLVWKQSDIYKSQKCTYCNAYSRKHKLVPSITGKPIIK